MAMLNNQMVDGLMEEHIYCTGNHVSFRKFCGVSCICFLQPMLGGMLNSNDGDRLVAKYPR